MTPGDRALEIFKAEKTVTRTDLEKKVGAGPYASKFVWWLKKQGHNITTQKDGRTVVSYTYEGAGVASTKKKATVSEVIEKVAKPKAATAKPVAMAAAKKKKAPAKAKTVAPRKAPSKPVASAPKVEVPIKEETLILGKEQPASYNVDADWDDVGVDNIKALL